MIRMLIPIIPGVVLVVHLEKIGIFKNSNSGKGYYIGTPEYLDFHILFQNSDLASGVFISLLCFEF